MTKPIRGRRDPFSDEWHWEPTSEVSGRRRGPPSTPFLLAALALAVIAAAAAITVLVGDENGGESVDTPPATPSAGSPASGDGTESPEATPTATTGPPSATLTLFTWSRRERQWIEGQLGAPSGYSEGDTVPVMLRIEGTGPRASYQATVAYQCATERGAAIDFLSSPAESDAESLLVPPAPPGPPDSAVPIPDDESIAFDDGRGFFQLWGGIFSSSPEGTLTPGACREEKSLEFAFSAARDAALIAWGLHLASAEDWGEGRGAGSAQDEMTVRVQVDGEEEARLVIAAGAIEP